MRKWLKRLKAAVVMGGIWGVIWGLVGGFVMEAIVDPHGRIGDMWPPFFVMLGFVAGSLFSVLLWISEGRRRFDELSIPRLSGIGALGGGLLGTFAALQMNETVPFWIRAVAVVGPTTLCAASAASTLALARRAENRVNAPSSLSELEMTNEEARQVRGS